MGVAIFQSTISQYFKRMVITHVICYIVYVMNNTKKKPIKMEIPSVLSNWVLFMLKFQINPNSGTKVTEKKPFYLWQTTWKYNNTTTKFLWLYIYIPILIPFHKYIVLNWQGTVSSGHIWTFNFGYYQFAFICKEFSEKKIFCSSALVIKKSSN